MVTYQKWTSIAFDVAKARGMDTSSQEANADAVSTFAEIWRDRKDELATATVAEARAVAQEEINVA